jgi:hypothetical protein
VSNLISEFFNFNGPCPDKIPNCQQLREDYAREIEEKRASGCRSCEETRIKTKYMETVWNAFVDSLS